MAVVPQIREFTVCEINRELLTVKNETDTAARDAYAKVLGLVFHPIPFQIEDNSSITARKFTGEELNGDGNTIVPDRQNNLGTEDGFASKGITLVKAIMASSLGQIFSPNDVKVMKNSKLLQAVSWHKNKHILAFISGSNQVSIYDFQDLDCREPSILSSESQKGVEAVDWRPNSGTTLAVACSEGICIWTASYPGNVASARSGNPSHLSMPTRRANVRWMLVDTLKSPYCDTVTTISWSPNGRFLASASQENSSIIIWDVAMGIGNPLRRGLGGTLLLKWSPTGDYLFSTKLNGTFYLWETSTWTSEPWSTAGNCVNSATWSPDGRMLLMSFSESMTLGALHFSGRPPSLDAHLIPLELPEIGVITNGFGSVEKMAWDGHGERLAISYTKGDHLYSGLIAIYDTKRAPIIGASLVGFIRGPGEQVKPLAFGFHDRFKQGPLLSVCWSSGICCTYPLILRA